MKTLRRLIHGEIIRAVSFVALGFLALFVFFDLSLTLRRTWIVLFCLDKCWNVWCYLLNLCALLGRRPSLHTAQPSRHRLDILAASLCWLLAG